MYLESFKDIAELTSLDENTVKSIDKKRLQELFTVDLIKEKLSYAYTLTDEAKMAEAISDIMDICESTGNKHLHWFYKLLDSHFKGILAHAT